MPFTFNIYATYKTSNADRIEKMLHKLLDQFKFELRAREKTESGRERVREFFAMDVEAAFEYLQTVAGGFGEEDSVTLYKKSKEQIEEEKVAKKTEVQADKMRAANFSFERKGIAKGAIVVFNEDEQIQAEVIDDRHILFESKKWTLSGLTKELKRRNGTQ